MTWAFCFPASVTENSVNPNQRRGIKTAAVDGALPVAGSRFFWTLTNLFSCRDAVPDAVSAVLSLLSMLSGVGVTEGPASCVDYRAHHCFGSRPVAPPERCFRASLVLANRHEVHRPRLQASDGTVRRMPCRPYHAVARSAGKTPERHKKASPYSAAGLECA